MTDDETRPVQDLVREAAERGAADIAEINEQARAEMEMEEKNRLNAWAEADAELGLPFWMAEYLDQPPGEWPKYRTMRYLYLPGCSPIEINSHNLSYAVMVPEEIVYDDDSDSWYIKTKLEPMPTLDAAIYKAAQYGESWDAMDAERDLRNLKLASPADDQAEEEDQPTSPWTDLDPAEEALKRADHCDSFGEAGLIWAVIALAFEVRGLNTAIMTVGAALAGRRQNVEDEE